MCFMFVQSGLAGYNIMIYINDIFDIFDIFDFMGFMSVRTCYMLKQSIPGKYQKYRDLHLYQFNQSTSLLMQVYIPATSNRLLQK